MYIYEKRAFFHKLKTFRDFSFISSHTTTKAKMSITTEQIVTTPVTFETGRDLTECTGGIDKVALAAAKKQAKLEKKEAAAAAKAAKEAAKAAKEAAKLDKARLATEKKEAAAAKEQKEIEKKRKAEEKLAKTETAATKKAERDAIKAASDAKKAASDAKKAASDAKKAAASEVNVPKLTSSADMQTSEINIITTQPAEEEVLLTTVTDDAAEIVSDLAISEVSAAAEQEVTAVAEEEVATAEEEVATAEEEVAAAAEEEVATEEEVVAVTEEEVAAAEEEVAAAEEEDELSIENIDKALFGNETTKEKIQRLRRQAGAFISEARQLEKTLPNQTENIAKNDDMREIHGILYSLDDKLLFNRVDELTGWIGSDGEVIFDTAWDEVNGQWRD